MTTQELNQTVVEKYLKTRKALHSKYNLTDDIMEQHDKDMRDGLGNMNEQCARLNEYMTTPITKRQMVKTYLITVDKLMYVSIHSLNPDEYFKSVRERTDIDRFLEDNKQLDPTDKCDMGMATIMYISALEHGISQSHELLTKMSEGLKQQEEELNKIKEEKYSLYLKTVELKKKLEEKDQAKPGKGK